MNNSVALIKKLKTNGATVYTFTPSMNDMLLMFGSNKNIQFNFSKFVCLNLPEWGNLNKQSMYKNPTQIESLNDTSVVDDANTFVPKAYIQNYIENFLSNVTARRTDSNNFSNPSEMAFWKSLSYISGVTEANNVKSTIQFDSINNNTEFIEKVDNSGVYDRVVTHIGDLNFTNHVKTNGKEYMEVYGLINSTARKNDNITFKKNSEIIFDGNQDSGKEYIYGHESTYENATSDEKTYTKAIYDTVDRKYNTEDVYSRLNIDWSKSEKLVHEANAENGNFDFNAILLYYDIWDTTNPTVTKRRNLFGVVFLDSFEKISSVTEKIPTFKKYHNFGDQVGNSYGFRFNFMFSNSTNNLTSNIVINDYSTISMEMYMKALEKLTTMTDLYMTQTQEIIELKNDLSQLKQLVMSINTRYGM